MIRYVDSSGWTWEVCEIAQDLEAGAESAPALPAARAHAESALRDPAARDPAPARRPPPSDVATARPTIAHADRVAVRSSHDAHADLDPYDGALYFLSRLGTRKLRQYPTGWHELPRTELEALCQSAELV